MIVVMVIMAILIVIVLEKLIKIIVLFIWIFQYLLTLMIQKHSPNHVFQLNSQQKELLLLK